jgi:hypothetical protein
MNNGLTEMFAGQTTHFWLGADNMRDKNKMEGLARLLFPYKRVQPTVIEPMKVTLRQR